MSERKSGNSKLQLENGAIKSMSSVGPIAVKFNRIDLKPNGDLCQITVSRDGQSVSMTTEQGKSLAEEILRRL